MQTATIPHTPAEPRDVRSSERLTRLESFAKSLRREATKLENEIAEEERQAGKKDPTAFDYPMTARSMRSRLKNIKVSLKTLETELAKFIHPTATAQVA